MTVVPRRQYLPTDNLPVVRVHCIGDSIVYGGGVSFDEAQPFHLEDALHQEYPDSLFVCTNLGHEGWNFWNSVLHHQALFAGQANPCDLMVLTLSNNDAELLGCYGMDYSKIQDKLIIFNDPIFSDLVEEGLVSLKDHAEALGSKLLVTFFEFYLPADLPVIGFIAEKCKKLGLPFVDLMSLTGERYALPFEQVVVSPADFHPNPHYHSLGARVLAQEIKRHGLVRVGVTDTDVLADLDHTLQGFLSDPIADHQAAYLWAYRAARAKEMVLPRRCADRTSRLATRNAAQALLDNHANLWSVWQFETEQKNLPRHLYQSILTHWCHFIPIKFDLIFMLEIMMAARYAIRTGTAETLETKVSAALLKDPAPQLDIVMSSMDEVQRRLQAFCDRFEEALASGSVYMQAPDSDLFGQCHAYLREQLALPQTVLSEWCAQLPQVIGASLTPSLENTLLCLAHRFSGAIGTLLDFLERQALTCAPHPPICATEVSVTVRSDGSFKEDVLCNGLGLVFRPECHAHVMHYNSTHTLVTSLTERIYVYRLPYFAAGTLFAELRRNYAGGPVDLERFHISAIDISRIYADPSLSKQLVQHFDYAGQNLQKVSLLQISV